MDCVYNQADNMSNRFNVFSNNNYTIKLDAKRVMSNWLMAAVAMKDGWRYASATNGEQ